MARRKLPRAATDRPTGARGRRHLPTLLGGTALAAVGCGALAYVLLVVQRGGMDARSRFSSTPDYLYATEEPFWFYGLTAALAIVGLTALAVAARMLLGGIRGGTEHR